MKTKRILWASLAVAIAVCVSAFAGLAVYTEHQNEGAINEAGGICLEQMATQIRLHFRSVLGLYVTRLNGLLWIVPPDQQTSNDQAYRELARCGENLQFCYVALYDAAGNCEVVASDAFYASVEIDDEAAFLKSAALDRGRITDGAASDGETLIVLGAPASYPMRNGSASTVLAVGVPIERLSRALSLDVSETQVYSHIIRADGSFVLRNSGSADASFFQRIEENAHSEGEKPEETLDRLKAAMALGEPCSLALEKDGLMHNVCVSPLPDTDWFIVSVLPQSLISEPLEDLVDRRTVSMLAACGVLLLVILVVFVLNFGIERRQIKLVEAARREADAANRAKSVFLSNVSHDIRTPMNAIMGLANVSLGKVGEPDIVESNLRKIALSSKHLLGIINNVLDMSLIESGKLTLNKNCTALTEIVESVTGVMQPQMDDKNITFDVLSCDVEGLYVVCDSVRLSQVLLNLLSNALKFTGEGGTVAFRISQRPAPESEGNVVVDFSVRDNGIGMSEEFQKRIFGSFERENTTNVQRTEGSGLGMAITRSIVDAMGGTIRVTSEQGKGSEFVVTLTLESFCSTGAACDGTGAARGGADAYGGKDARGGAEECRTRVAEDREGAAAEPGACRIAGKRILVAEDQELNWEVASALLEPYGPLLEWAKDGLACFERFKASAPGYYDAILMDLQMPRMDGYQATRAIRDLASERSDAAIVPIIAMTADVFSGDVVRSIGCGMNAHVSKPIDVKILVKTLAASMEHRSSTV